MLNTVFLFFKKNRFVLFKVEPFTNEIDLKLSGQLCHVIVKTRTQSFATTTGTKATEMKEKKRVNTK